MSAAYDWMDYSERMLRARDREDPGRRVPGADAAGSTTTRATAACRLRVETKVIVEGDEITIDLTGSNPEVPTGYNVPFEGSLLVGALLRGAHDPARRGDVPRARAAERRRLPAGEGDRAEGDDLQPDLPARVLLALLPGAARRRQHDPRARRRAAGEGHGRQLGRHPLLRLLGLLRGDGRVLALPRGERGLVRRPLRQGRDGLGRQPDGEHAQQPDRGARHALPDALRPVRAAAGAGRAREAGAAASGSSAATASSSTASTPARATARTTRRAASSAAGTGSSPRAARTPTRAARRSCRRR